MVMGGIVPVVNLEGIKAGEIVLDGTTLAKIFLGKITKWNDAAIKALNPGVALPSQAIAVVHRSDGSGTTFNFTYYLADVSADWKSKVGVEKAVQWPVGIGAKGNEGVANNVGNTAGSIGYVEYAYALQNKPDLHQDDEQGRQGGCPDSEAFSAAAANADWSSQPGYGVILANQPGDESWPMTAATWILMYKQPRIRRRRLRRSSSSPGATRTATRWRPSLDYVPMPDNVVKDIEAYWSKEIKDSNGKPVFAAM